MKVMIKIPRDYYHLQIKVQINVGPTPTPKLGMRPRRPVEKCVCVCVWGETKYLGGGPNDKEGLVNYISLYLWGAGDFGGEK